MFETKEDADKFLANKEIKFENTELLKETKWVFDFYYIKFDVITLYY